MKRLVLIDSHAVIHRAYHALPPLTTPAGDPINAVYGFTTILLRILRELKPDYVAAAFDLSGPTFRHVAYERYKAQRPETPSDLASQFAKTKELLASFGIPVFEKEGYEADDVIGTIAKKLEKQKNIEIIVVTGDMDTLQLVRPRLKVYAMKKGISDTVIYNEKAVRERYGFGPKQLVDFKGLRGDPSDNIPGVKGVGEKTATELIKKFGSIESIYKALKTGNKKISSAVAERLRAGKDDALFSKELATIKTDVPVEIEFTELAKKMTIRTLPAAARALFQKFGFSSLLKRFNSEEAARPKQEALLPVQKRNGAVALSLETSSDFKKHSRELSAGDLGLILEGGPSSGASLAMRGGQLFLVLRNGQKVFQLGKNIFSDKSAKDFFAGARNLFVHEGKSVIHFLRTYGIVPGPFNFDLSLASYIAGAGARDFSYAGVAGRELGRLVSANATEEYRHFFEVVESLEAKLAPGKLKHVFEKIEMPLIPVLADMEDRGIRVDGDFLNKLAGKVDGDLGELTEEIYRRAGEEFNINSSQQLSRILFEKLELKAHGLRKTPKGGVISTGAAELEKLREAHPIVEKILNYRELAKLKNTYIDTLPALINPRTGRIHTTFNQTGTSTGRLSSSDPNMQNIPTLSEYGKEVRKAFVADKGFLLVSFDYSQIELRVAAHLAEDKKMIEAFQKGLDIHKMTAAEIYNVPLEKVTPELRRAAKTLNFGVLYGMGSQALAESTGMSREDARKFIDEYFHDFSGIRKYIEDTKNLVEERGYVETLFGRRRAIPEIHSLNWQVRREAERMAINMPIQGTATGDIVKMAMIAVDRWIEKDGMESGVRMLLQVHDELLFEIKGDLVKSIVPKIKGIMEGVAKLKVPLVVDVKAGKSWGEQEPIN